MNVIYNDNITVITHQDDNTITIVQDDNAITDTQQVILLTRKEWQALVNEVTKTYMLKDEYTA